jgi:hypothetical protein
MAYFRFAPVCLALLAAGCHQSSTHSDERPAVMQQEARTRPRVAIVPVIDHSVNGCRWNLSEEFTSQICDELYQKDNMRMVNPNKAKALLRNAKVDSSPFEVNVDWVKKVFKDDEFVVFMELVEHQEIYRQEQGKLKPVKDCSADLNMSMRVRVLDLREEKPQVVLQELVHHTHFIPKQYTEKNYFHASWNYDSFALSPTGLAHEEFIRDIASQINAYIVLSVNELP